MFTVAIARYLEELGLIEFDEAGTGGDTAIDTMPTVADTAVGIFSTGGFEGDFKFAFDEPTFQVRTRGARDKDPRTAFARCREIYNALHGIGDRQIGDYWVHKIKGMQSYPQSLGIDENNRHEYSINFAAEVKAPVGNRQ